MRGTGRAAFTISTDVGDDGVLDTVDDDDVIERRLLLLLLLLLLRLLEEEEEEEIRGRMGVNEVDMSGGGLTTIVVRLDISGGGVG